MRRFALLAILLALAPAFLWTQVSAEAGSPLRSGARARIPPAAHLGPLSYISQTLNNCGPASIAEVLAYWHVARTQQQVQAAVRADHSPHGMAPYGVPSYSRSVGLDALLGVAGTPRLIKALISKGFPVIVSQWVSAATQIRHYRPIEAYDDRQRIFVSSDPYLGPGHEIGYPEFSHVWSVSDNRFIVIFPSKRRSALSAALAAAGWNFTRAYQHDLAWEKARLRDKSRSVPSDVLFHYAYTSLAWDEMELGHYAAARDWLRSAAQHGTSPILLSWIRQEIRRRERR